MSRDWFLSVAEPCERTLIITKSKFITTLIPIDSYDDAIKKLKTISKKYSDATHNCYAFISNECATEQRFGDDGEPQGTAGMPMLEVLRKRKVYMTLAVVTRYFGGVKLGANGLVGAYSSSVAEALDSSKTVKNVWADIVKITLGYGLYKKAEEICLRLGAQIIGEEFDNEVTAEIAIPQEVSKSAIDKIVDLTLNKAEIIIKDSRYFQFGIN